MPTRKPLFKGSDAFPEEMARTDSATFGGLTLLDDIFMSNNKITNLGPGLALGDAISFGQLGVVLSGLNVAGNKITGGATGTDPTDFVIVSQLTGSSADEKVKISSTDTTSNYLELKLSAGSGVFLNKLNPGANEQIRVDVPNILTTFDHKHIRHMIHYLEGGPPSGAFYEIAGSTLFPTNKTWYTNSAKTHKIFEKLIERSIPPATNIAPTPIEYKLYSIDGSTVIAHLKDDIVYSGVFSINRTRTVIINE